MNFILPLGYYSPEPRLNAIIITDTLFRLVSFLGVSFLFDLPLQIFVLIGFSRKDRLTNFDSNLNIFLLEILKR